jgi:hypothetical protein
MASTRSKNTQGDYVLEQRNNTLISQYSAYENSSYGAPVNTHFSGDGLLMGRIAPTKLSDNSCDIESQLFGIGSTNLVIPKEPVHPILKPIQSLSIADRIPLLIPEPLVVEKNQRPYPMH